MELSTGYANNNIPIKGRVSTIDLLSEPSEIDKYLKFCFNIGKHPFKLSNDIHEHTSVLERLVYEMAKYHIDLCDGDINSKFISFWLTKNDCDSCHRMHTDSDDYTRENDTDDMPLKNYMTIILYLDDSIDPLFVSNMKENTEVDHETDMIVFFPRKYKSISFEGGKYYHGVISNTYETQRKIDNSHRRSIVISVCTNRYPKHAPFFPGKFTNYDYWANTNNNNFITNNYFDIKNNKKKLLKFTPEVNKESGMSIDICKKTLLKIINGEHNLLQKKLDGVFSSELYNKTNWFVIHNCANPVDNIEDNDENCTTKSPEYDTTLIDVRLNNIERNQNNVIDFLFKTSDEFRLYIEQNKKSVLQTEPEPEEQKELIETDKILYSVPEPEEQKELIETDKNSHTEIALTKDDISKSFIENNIFFRKYAINLNEDTTTMFINIIKATQNKKNELQFKINITENFIKKKKDIIENIMNEIFNECKKYISNEKNINDDYTVEFWFKSSILIHDDNIHIDRDETLKIKSPYTKHPDITALLYLCDTDVPTFCSNINKDDSTQFKDSKLLVNFPKKNTIIFLNGGFNYHWVSNICKEQYNNNNRYLIPINIYKNHNVLCLEDYNSRKITNKYNNISIAESYNIKLNIEKNIGNILLNDHNLDVQLKKAIIQRNTSHLNYLYNKIQYHYSKKKQTTFLISSSVNKHIIEPSVKSLTFDERDIDSITNSFFIKDKFINDDLIRTVSEFETHGASAINLNNHSNILHILITKHFGQITKYLIDKFNIESLTDKKTFDFDIIELTSNLYDIEQHENILDNEYIVIIPTKCSSHHNNIVSFENNLSKREINIKLYDLIIINNKCRFNVNNIKQAIFIKIVLK